MTRTLPTQRVTIRLAQPHEGPVIESMMRTYGGPTWDWLDWSTVYPYWLIGEVEAQPRGCVMVNPGQPFGRVEFLAVDPQLPQASKAILCRDLCYAGVASCQQMGSQAVLSNIDTGDGTWRQIAEKRGWVVTGEGSYMMKRCV